MAGFSRQATVPLWPAVSGNGFSNQRRRDRRKAKTTQARRKSKCRDSQTSCRRLYLLLIELQATAIGLCSSGRSTRVNRFQWSISHACSLCSVAFNRGQRADLRLVSGRSRMSPIGDKSLATTRPVIAGYACQAVARGKGR